MDQMTPTNLAYDPIAAARQVAITAARRAGEQDCDAGFPVEDIANLARLGLLVAPVPSDEGGPGLGEEPDACDLAAVLRLVGYGSLALGRLYEGHVNALQLVARYGTPSQRSRLFADARNGQLFGVWNTDPPGGCLRLGEDRRLHGVKTFASGAGYVTRALVTVKREPGAPPLMLVVPLKPGSRADLTGWRAHGMRASATGTVDFEDIAVTEDEILGGWDDYHRQPVFSGGAWRFAAVQLGGIEAVFDAWRGHLAATDRGGDAHQLARLGEGAIAVESARGWVERAARIVAEDELAPERTVAFVNLARLAVERVGLDVLQLAQRSVGLQGFLREHPLERLSRDLATYLRQPAPDRALTTAAAEILESHGIAGDLFEAGLAR